MKKARLEKSTIKRNRSHWIISTLIALFLGTLVGFSLSIRYKGFWDLTRVPRLSVLFFLIISMVIVSLMAILLLNKMIHKENQKKIIATYLAFIIVSAVLWFVKVQHIYKNRVPMSWMDGLGRALEKPVGAVLFIFVIPLIAGTGIFLILEIIGWLVKKIKWDILIKYYSALFCMGFLLVCMAPVVKNGNLKTVDKSFSGRSQLLRLYNNTRYRLGDRVIGETFIEGDWVILSNADSIMDYQNTEPFSGEELKEINRKLVGVKEYLDERGIAFLVISPPNKNTIYPEYFPETIPVIGEQSRLDQLIEYVGKHSDVKIADMRDAMMEYREEHQLYYATDTHWNPYGAWVGYRVILEALKADFPGLEPHDLDEYNFTQGNVRSGDAALRLANVDIPESFFNLRLKNGEEILKTSFKNDFYPSLTVNLNPDSSLPRLLLYHDSFTFALMPFLADHFSNASYLRVRDTGKDVEYDISYVEIAEPDVVIIELTERLIERLLLLPDL